MLLRLRHASDVFSSIEEEVAMDLQHQHNVITQLSPRLDDSVSSKRPDSSDDITAPSNQTLLNCLLDVMPHFVFWKDIHSRYLGCNEAFAKLLGFHHPCDIIGKTDYDLQWQSSGDTAAFFQAADKATLHDQHLTNHEEELHVPHHDPMTVLVNKCPLKNSQGQVIGILGTALDISVRKALQRTQQQHTQSIIALSHDLRTPLTSLVGLLNAMQQSQHLSQIHTWARELMRTTESLHTVCESTLEHLYRHNEAIERNLSTQHISFSNASKILPLTKNANPKPSRPLSGHLLLVEDNPLVTKALVALLQLHGDLEIDTANTALTAVERATQKRYDLILMDLGLPDHDGLWVTQRIRTHSSKTANQNVPIVALSAYMNPELRHTCLNAGMQAAITKPLTTITITTCLSQWLSPNKEANTQ